MQKRGQTISMNKFFNWVIFKFSILQYLRCFEVRDTESKGKGVFALRQIAMGELVMKERPLVLVTTPHTPKTLAKYVAELRGQVHCLDEDQQDDFFSFSIARPELCTKDRSEL